MPQRFVREYKRGKKKKIKVKAYVQEYKKPRGKPPSYKEKIKISPRAQSRTSWLKNKRGYFTGRADAEGNTTSITHVEGQKDYTGIVKGKKYGRIYGRYGSKAGRIRLKEENIRAHPK